MIKTTGYAAKSASAPLDTFSFERREPTPQDVQIEILYCGVCHSDLHTVRNEWKLYEQTIYPVVPGHEIVGRVAKVGQKVKKFKSGDMVGVGCMVDSCRICPPCQEGQEQFCENGLTLTYNSPDKHTGGITYGGYSQTVVVDQNYVVRIPDGMDAAGAAPLLCAGITTYSPLRHWKVGPGHKVGIVGLGGLGHIGVKLAHAMGAEVVLFTTSTSKTEDAKRMGADQVVLSKNLDDMKNQANSFDFILDTVAASHSLDVYTDLLKRDGTLCLVGIPEHAHPSPSAMTLISKRCNITGSPIGGIAQTQEMLDFCAAHGIISDIEMIPMDGINEAYERMLKSDVKYRFVIDMASLQEAA